MESIEIPKQITVYALIKQNGMTFSYTGASAANLGLGFFLTQLEAEHARTLELLREQSVPTATPVLFHVFPITVPHPAFKQLRG